MYMRSVIAGTVTVFLLAACGSETDSSDAAAVPSSLAATASSAVASPSAGATSVAAATPASSSVASGSRAQCAAIKKVYTAWAKMNTSLTARGVDAAIGAGDAFADVVRAYDDQASKELKREVTGYNVQVLIARAQIAQGTLDSTTRENLKADHDDVVAKYDAFRTAAACT
ncbi:hypothetical protein ACTOB_002671 [Actinoplanes oblitus]|uniref:Lipoprotein n=1 Tax=Actinoplanes oblitus TaxID=3040509 RepID=A0ABY8WTQ6_9ACTN|nr:hypothetical protein [Actinoplanes oblitus]WIN01034.1 hypothetical protein ACTOB_002671 [Actinoplanes oblitus]